ncbi:MAG: 4a-hydroxytetrahydrobiopterin dehydratase, partial [Nitrososphaerales archaeon]
MNGWRHERDFITKTFEFDSFMEGIAFIDRLALVAEEHEHHPDIQVRYTSIKATFFLVRPLLHVAKARLVATLKAASIGHSEDPTNRDPRFARTRLRTLMPTLAREGLDARGLARLAARMRRAEATIEFAVAAARAALTPEPWRERGPIVFEAVRF